MAKLLDICDLYVRKTLFHIYMSIVVRKPVFGVSDQVRHKPGCTATEDCQRLDKGADQLQGCHRAADLSLRFCIYAKSRISSEAVHIVIVLELGFNSLPTFLVIFSMVTSYILAT